MNRLVYFLLFSFFSVFLSHCETTNEPQVQNRAWGLFILLNKSSGTSTGTGTTTATGTSTGTGTSGGPPPGFQPPPPPAIQSGTLNHDLEQ